MKSIGQIIDGPMSSYTGSEKTRALVEQQIRERWGETEVKNIDCYRNIRTFHGWLGLNYKVKKGEKSLKSFTCIETKDKNGNVIKRYRKPVSLFYYRQVQKIGPEKTV